jgi:hypothetical protein
MKKKSPKPSGFKAFSAPEPAKVEDSSGEQVTGLWIKAVLMLGVAIFIGVKMGGKWSLDMNDPEFNPLIVVVLGLGVFGLVTLGQALWLGSKRKRFGRAEMQITGDGVARLGQVMLGTVRTAKPLSGAEMAKVTLSCVDTHQFRDLDVQGSADHHAFVIWEAGLEVPLAGLDTMGKGIPFRFEMPEKVGEEPKKKEPGNPYFKGKFALMIPGMKRRIWAYGEQPVVRVWRLEVRSETTEGAFRVVFDVPVEQR